MTKTKTVFVAYSNTDLTEGRGYDVPIAVCRIEATARRLAHKRHVQGTDGPVRAVDFVEIDGNLFAPESAFHLVEPTREDEAKQRAIDARKAAVAKAKAAGLTDDELSAIRSVL